MMHRNLDRREVMAAAGKGSPSDGYLTKCSTSDASVDALLGAWSGRQLDRLAARDGRGSADHQVWLMSTGRAGPA